MSNDVAAVIQRLIELEVMATPKDWVPIYADVGKEENELAGIGFCPENTSGVEPVLLIPDTDEETMNYVKHDIRFACAYRNVAEHVNRVLFYAAVFQQEMKIWLADETAALTSPQLDKAEDDLFQALDILAKVVL